MTSETSPERANEPPLAKPRRNPPQVIVFALVAMGSLMVLAGMRGLVRGELTDTRRMRTDRQRIVGYTLSGTEARVFSGSLLAMGCGFLLSLAFVPGMANTDFARVGLVQLPLWQLGVAFVMVMLVLGGLFGMVASVLMG